MKFKILSAFDVSSVRRCIFLAVVFSIPAASCNQVPAGTPPDYGFIFKTQLVDVYTLDTFKGTLRRTAASGRDTTVSFQLTKSQLDSVYGHMKAIDFFSLPEYLEPELNVKVFPSPWSTYSVRVNGVIKHVSFGGSFTAGVRSMEDLKRLNEILIGMVRASVEYQNLSKSPDAAM